MYLFLVPASLTFHLCITYLLAGLLFITYRFLFADVQFFSFSCFIVHDFPCFFFLFFILLFSFGFLLVFTIYFSFSAFHPPVKSPSPFSLSSSTIFRFFLFLLHSRIQFCFFFYLLHFFVFLPLIRFFNLPFIFIL